jgi:bla regulator protein BlaR1
MTDFLTIGLSNAIAATLLAVLAAVVGGTGRRPALAHGLWLLVLVKLITPPIVPVQIALPQALARAPALHPAVPDTDKLDVGLSSVAGPQTNPETIVCPRELPAKDEELSNSVGPLSADWRPAIFSAWLAGSVAWWGLAGIRLYRFGRLLRLARPVPLSVQTRIKQLGGRLGLRSVPDTRFARSAMSPLLWSLGRAPCLLLPEALWEKLNEEQRDTLLVHELAHLRRRDHWTRLLELVVLGLYWWHPVAWWARARLREAEEHC